VHRRDVAAVPRVRFPVRLVELVRDPSGRGGGLAGITELLALRDTGQCPCEPAAALLRTRVRHVG
jgi:hypothetical protein